MERRGLFTINRLEPGTPEIAIEPVLALSNKTFNTVGKSPTHHSSLEEWHKRLSEPNSLLVYATATEEDPSKTASSSSMPVGFIFANARAEQGESSPALHIWLAGVSEDARGSGVFAAMMDQIEVHARAKEFNAMSVCTFPQTFGRMYSILQGQGWEVKTWMEGGKKVLMVKRL